MLAASFSPSLRCMQPSIPGAVGVLSKLDGTAPSDPLSLQEQPGHHQALVARSASRRSPTPNPGRHALLHAAATVSLRAYDHLLRRTRTSCSINKIDAGALDSGDRTAARVHPPGQHQCRDLREVQRQNKLCRTTDQAEGVLVSTQRSASRLRQHAARRNTASPSQGVSSTASLTGEHLGTCSDAFEAWVNLQREITKKAFPYSFRQATPFSWVFHSLHLSVCFDHRPPS